MFTIIIHWQEIEAAYFISYPLEKKLKVPSFRLPNMTVAIVLFSLSFRGLVAI